MNHLSKTRREKHTRLAPFALLCLLLLSLLLTACPETSTAPTDPPSNPVIPPGEPTGSLQFTVEGLPDGADASVLVAGPEEYSSAVTSSQTLQNLRTGSYSLEVQSVEFRDATYSGAFEGSNQTEITVDVTEGETTAVEVTYTSVGSVEEGSIAPGTAREGLVAENAFDDYAFQGTANVPLTFDFTGTGEENTGNYRVLIFAAEDLEEPLNSTLYGTFGQAPILGFSPPENGGYVLRIRGENNIVDYRVRAQYLSGPPEERQTPTVINYGDTAKGAVTSGSYDEYRFTGTFNETILLSFSYDGEDSRYTGNYRVEFYRVGQEEPIETSPLYSSFGTPPEIDFTPQEDGDYLIRVVGAGSQGRSLVRYSFGLERLE